LIPATDSNQQFQAYQKKARKNPLQAHNKSCLNHVHLLEMRHLNHLEQQEMKHDLFLLWYSLFQHHEEENRVLEMQFKYGARRFWSEMMILQSKP